MTNKKRKWTIIIGGILIFFVIGYFVVQNVVKSKIEHFLAHKLPETIELKYDHLTLSLFRAKVEINNINLMYFK